VTETRDLHSRGDAGLVAVDCATTGRDGRAVFDGDTGPLANYRERPRRDRTRLSTDSPIVSAVLYERPLDPRERRRQPHVRRVSRLRSDPRYLRVRRPIPRMCAIVDVVLSDIRLKLAEGFICPQNLSI